MSAHPQERLSAFLDDELPPQERVQIEQHLRNCAECAQELSELAQVDRWGRELDVDVPEGYLDGLPARLRPRLRAARQVRRRIVPMWALAAAALVLIGLLVPITWQRHRPELAIPVSKSHVAGPAPEQQAEPVLAAPAPTTAPSAPSPQAPPLTREPPRESSTTDRPRALDKGVGQDFAAPPRAAQPTGLAADEYRKTNDDLKPLGHNGDARRELRETPATPGADAVRARQFDPSAGGSAATTPGRAPNASLALPLPSAAPAATGAAVAKSAAPPPAAAAEPASVPRTATGTLELDDESSSAKRERGAAESYRLTQSEKRRDEPKVDTMAPTKSFSEIASQSPHSVAEARIKRRAWREFADSHPSDSRADEARVRSVEAAALAYRLSGDPADKQTLADDVREYLKRGDAKQKDRVRVLSAP